MNIHVVSFCYLWSVPEFLKATGDDEGEFFQSAGILIIILGVNRLYITFPSLFKSTEQITDPKYDPI